MLTDKDKNNIIVLAVPEAYKKQLPYKELTYAQFMDNSIFEQLRKDYIQYEGMLCNTNALEDLINCVAVEWQYHNLLLDLFDGQMEMLCNDAKYTRKHHFGIMLFMMRACLRRTFKDE